MASILEIDHGKFFEEQRRNEALQKWLDSPPSWRELIDILSEIKGQVDTLEAFASEMMLKGYVVTGLQDREAYLSDFATKIGLSTRGRAEVLRAELAATFFDRSQARNLI